MSEKQFSKLIKLAVGYLLLFFVLALGIREIKERGSEELASILGNIFIPLLIAFFLFMVVVILHEED